MPNMRAMIAGFMLTGLAAAGNAFAAPDNVPWDRTITRIQTYANYAVVVFSPNFANTQSCSRPAQDRVIVNWAGDGDRKGMLATIMLARATASNVGFGISGCHPTGYPLVYRVDMPSP